MRRHTCRTFLHQTPARIFAVFSPGLGEPYLTKTMSCPCKQGVANHLQPNTRQVGSCLLSYSHKVNIVQNLLDKSYLSNYTLGCEVRMGTCLLNGRCCTSIGVTFGGSHVNGISSPASRFFTAYLQPKGHASCP